MPEHDSPESRVPSASDAWSQYRRLMKWMVLVSAAAALSALLYLSLTGAPMRPHMIFATFLGVFMTVLLGTALMGLVFASANSGHDDRATRKKD